MTTAHGFWEPLLGGGGGESNVWSLLKLILTVLKRIHDACALIGRDDGAEEGRVPQDQQDWEANLLWLLTDCRKSIRGIARAMCLRRRVNPDLAGDGRVFFDGFLR